MRVHALDIPDDPAQLPAWLERHLVGLDLAALIAELSAVHAAAGPGPSLDALLAGRKEAVLANGLGVLPQATLKEFLTRPRLLLELQELILVGGGAYWDRVAPPSAELEAHVEQGRQRLERLFAQAERAAPEERRVLRLPSGPAWYRRPWVASLAAAAAVLLGVFLFEHYRSPAGKDRETSAVAWGWSRPDALPDKMSPEAYLNRLADEAAEWFDRRPDEPVALAKRLGELREGCSVLILSPHPPLAAADRQWLVEKCRLWAAQFDQQLTALEAGGDPLQIRAQTDETVHKLITALRGRAKEATTA